MLVEKFLENDPVRLGKLKAQLKAPLRDATAMNIVRPAILRQLHATGLPVSCWSGARTKWNRDRQGMPKDHHLDASCVGNVKAIHGWEGEEVLMVTACGHGTRQRQLMDSYGFPRGKAFPKEKNHYGFQTGDIVKAVVTKGKKAGAHVGRVAVRSTGRFNIKTASGTVQGIGWKNCTILQRKDGYTYSIAVQDRIHPTGKPDGFPAEDL